MEQQTCNCPDPALCQRLKKHIFGRLWDIWNGFNIDPKTAEKYRKLWERQAGLAKEERPEQGPKGGCGCGRKA